jgi:hypothetical protein
MRNCLAEKAKRHDRQQKGYLAHDAEADHADSVDSKDNTSLLSLPVED